jgi:hypothetical protein
MKAVRASCCASITTVARHSLLRKRGNSANIDLHKLNLVKGVLMLKIGEMAPEFTVTTHEGQLLSLSSLRGHKILLWFYPKADTGG